MDSFVRVETEALVKGRGGSIFAAQELVNAKAATDYDWRALECVGTNGIGGTIRLMRTRPGDEECTTFLQEIKPNVVIGNVEPGESGVDIVQVFVRTEARTLLIKFSPQVPNSELWRTSIQPMLYASSRQKKAARQKKAELKAASVEKFHSVNRGRIILSSGGPYQTSGGVMAADGEGHKKCGESCPWLFGRGLTGRGIAAGSSVSVGVPSGKKRAFMAATTTAATPKANEKLHAWRRGVEKATGPKTSLGGILGRNGA